MNAKAQSQAKSSFTPSFTPAPVNLVQRKCACGGSAGLSGECAECRKEKLLGEDAPLVQPKLKISQPNDKYEQEADRVADEVMRMPEPKVQRQVRAGEEEDEETIQAKPIANRITSLVQRQIDSEEDKELQVKELPSHTPVVTPQTQARINAMRGDGQPLSKSEREFYEPRFGVDFSRTRIHTGPLATVTAGSLNARAFTVGQDIFFNEKEYQIGTDSGQRLLAHELTHTLQQNSRVGKRINRALVPNPTREVIQNEAVSRQRTIPFFKTVNESLALVLSQTFPDKLSFKQALQLIASINEGEEFTTFPQGKARTGRGEEKKKEFEKLSEDTKQFNITPETFALIVAQVAKTVQLDELEVGGRIDKTLASFAAVTETSATQSIDPNADPEKAEFVSAAERGIISALGEGISEYVNAGEIKVSDNPLEQQVRSLANNLLRTYFGLSEQLANAHVGNLIIQVPPIEHLQSKGITTLVVVADVGRIKAFLLSFETPSGEPLIDEDNIPGNGLPSADSIEEAALMNSFGEFFELAATALDIAPTVAVGATVKTKTVKESVKQSSKQARRAARQAKKAAKKAHKAARKAKRGEKIAAKQARKAARQAKKAAKKAHKEARKAKRGEKNAAKIAKGPRKGFIEIPGPTEKQAGAISKLQDTLSAGGNWSDLSGLDRARIGTYLGDVTEELSRIIFQGVGKTVKGGRFTIELFEEFAKKGGRVLFVQGKLRRAGKFDLLEIDFSKGRAILIDLTSTSNAKHIRKTRRYLATLQEVTGIPVNAIEMRYIGTNSQLLSILESISL